MSSHAEAVADLATPELLDTNLFVKIDEFRRFALAVLVVAAVTHPGQPRKPGTPAQQHQQGG